MFHPARLPDAIPTETMAATDLPEWIRSRRELWYKGKLVKKLRRSAIAQIALLDAFSKRRGKNGEPDQDGTGWHNSVPVPKKEITSPKKLSDAIDALNEGQKNRLLEFWADGKYDFICWSPIAQPPSQ